MKIKLNKQEISSLANKIYNDRRKKLAEDKEYLIKVFKKTAEFKKIEKDVKLVQSIFDKYYDEDSHRWNKNNLSVNSILKNYKELEIEEKHISISDIENSIILAQIESDSLDEIIKKVTENLK